MSRRPPLSVVILAGAALALSACGKVGELDRPAPLWGEKAKADYAAQQKAAADAQAQKDAQDRAQRGRPAPLPSPDSGPSAGPSDPQHPQ
jgi:hypothetical protein